MTDRTGQSAIQAIAISGTRQTSAAGGGGAGTGIKWHPGHYLNFGPWLALPDTVTSKVNIPSYVSEIASMSTIKGFFIAAYWGALETTQGNYKFDVIDQIVALAQSAGKRFILGVKSSAFSAGNVDYQVSQGRFPAYLRDTYNGIYQSTVVVSGTPRVDAKIWTAPVMDRLIALHQAIAARYDTNPYYEGSATSEIQTSQSSPDWSATNLLNQYLRMLPALKTAYAHTNMFICANSAFSDAQNIQFLQAMIANRMILGGPDIRPNDFVSGGAGGTMFQRIYYGLDFGVDYRGQIACGPEIQAPNLGGVHTPTTGVLAANLLLQLIYDKSQNPLQCSYLIWERKDYGMSSGGTDNDQFWTAAVSGYTFNTPTIKTFLTSGVGTIPVVTTPPTNYAAYGTDTS